MEKNPDENIIEFIRQSARSLRKKEIEYADQRQYELAAEMKQKIEQIVDEVCDIYPNRSFSRKEVKEMLGI
jgi:hypothetical protein